MCLQFQKSTNLMLWSYFEFEEGPHTAWLIWVQNKISLIRNRTETLLTIFSGKKLSAIGKIGKTFQATIRFQICIINLYYFSHNLNANQILSKLAVIRLKIIMLMVIQKLHVKFADFLPKKSTIGIFFKISSQFFGPISHYNKPSTI